MASQIHLIRHGETAWSLSGQHTGNTDVPLTENGERQASDLGIILGRVTFTRVLTSPLQRARRTCELAGFGAVARVEPDLREWDYGAYEGRKTAEILFERPGWNVFEDGSPEGESVAQISQRVDRVLAGLRSTGGTTALFSHGHLLRALAVRWVGLPVGEGRHLALGTASMCILGYEHADEKMPCIWLWNATVSPRSVG